MSAKAAPDTTCAADGPPDGGPVACAPVPSGRPVRAGRRALALAGAAAVATGPTAVAAAAAGRTDPASPHAGADSARGRWLLRGADR